MLRWNIIPCFLCMATVTCACLVRIEDRILDDLHGDILIFKNPETESEVTQNNVVKEGRRPIQGTDVDAISNLRKRKIDVSIVKALYNKYLPPIKTSKGRKRPGKTRPFRKSVYMSVIVDDGSGDKKYVQYVTAKPRMTVFNVLLSAALRYRLAHRNQLNPFNAITDWDDNRYCEIITETLNTPNTSYRRWKIQIWKGRRIVYNGSCIPSRLRVRPGLSIVLRYT